VGHLDSRGFPALVWVLCRGNLGAAVASSRFPLEVSGIWGHLAYLDISSNTDAGHLTAFHLGFSFDVFFPFFLFLFK